MTNTTNKTNEVLATIENATNKPANEKPATTITNETKPATKENKPAKKMTSKQIEKAARLAERMALKADTTIRFDELKLVPTANFKAVSAQISDVINLYKNKTELKANRDLLDRKDAKRKDYTKEIENNEKVLNKAINNAKFSEELENQLSNACRMMLKGDSVKKAKCVQILIAKLGLHVDGEKNLAYTVNAIMKSITVKSATLGNKDGAWIKTSSNEFHKAIVKLVAEMAIRSA